MRVLYIPFFSSMHLGGCSIFNNMKVLLRRLVELNEDVFLYYPLPEDGDRFDVSAASYLEHPRIKTFRVRARSSQGQDAVFFPEKLFDMFHVVDGLHHVDVVICDKPRLTLWIKMLLNSQLRALSLSLPIVNISQYAFLTGSDDQKGAPEFEYSQLLGAFAADRNIWTHPKEKARYISVARKYAKGAVVKKILDSSVDDAGLSLDVGRMDSFESEKSRDEIVLNYASRMTEGYNVTEVLKAFEALYSSGKDTRMLITTPSAALGYLGNKLTKALRTRGAPFDAYESCAQEDFYRRVWKAHISLNFYPDTSLTVREQMYMRVAVIMKKGETWGDPVLEDYPYVFTNRKEMIGWLRYLTLHYWEDEVQGVLEKYRSHVRDWYSSDVKSAALYRTLREVVEESRPEDGQTSGALPLVTASLEGAGWPERFTYRELAAWFKKHTELKVAPERHVYRGRSRLHFVAAVRELGYRDDCATEDLSFVRKEDA